MADRNARRARYGMVIDLDRCLGCGSCAVACAAENNVPPTPGDADESRGLTWMRVERADNGGRFPLVETVRIPVPCQHCDNPPCRDVCPANAIETDPRSGIVTQVPARCMGCRYCMAACPYHARYFNWWDPRYPARGALNPDVSPRMRGVTEKCNLCHGRLKRALEKMHAEGRERLEPKEYVTACADACPGGAIRFGDLGDGESEVARLAAGPRSFRLLASLGTEPRVYYLTGRAWVRELGRNPRAIAPEEVPRG